MSTNFPNGITADVTGNLVGDVTGTVTSPVVEYAVNGAISIASQVAVITKATAATMTLADPTAGTHDGIIIEVVSATAAAHKLDNSAGGGFNNGGATLDVGTFGGAIGDSIRLLAHNGVWIVLNNINVTIGAT